MKCVRCDNGSLRKTLCKVTLCTWIFMLSHPLGCVFAAASPSAIRISQEKIVFMPDESQHDIEVILVEDVVNPTQTNADVGIDLPKDYRSLKRGDTGQAIHASGQEALLPGAAHAGQNTIVSITYSIPLQDDMTAEFTLHTPYDVDQARIYLQQGNYALSAQSLLTTTNLTNMNGTEYRVFTRLGIPAGDDWSMSLVQLPTSNHTASPNVPIIGAPLSSQKNLFQATMNLVVAAFVLVVGLLGIRSTTGELARRRQNQREALVHALERLEMDHTVGRTDDLSYEAQKRRLLDRIVHLNQQPEDGTGRPSL